MDVVTKTKMHFRKEQWKKFIQNREASGLSVASWCKQNGVAQSTYFKWLHRIRLDICQNLPEAQTVTPVPFVKLGSADKAKISEPIPASSSVTAAEENAIQIHLRNADITIPNGADPKTIRATLLALKEIC